MESPADQHYAPVAGRECAWYCIRSKPKHEHIAAKNLRRLGSLEVFNPRFRVRKITRRGPVWMTESLFPNYLFVHFSFHQMLDEVRFTPGVSCVIGFGGRYPQVAATVIEELRQSFPGDDLQVMDDPPRAGDAVIISVGPMFGLSGVVLRSLPARQRVQVLLDMLGQTATVELSVKDMVVENRALPFGLAVERRAA